MLVEDLGEMLGEDQEEKEGGFRENGEFFREFQGVFREGSGRVQGENRDAETEETRGTTTKSGIIFHYSLLSTLYSLFVSAVSASLCLP